VHLPATTDRRALAPAALLREPELWRFCEIAESDPERVRNTLPEPLRAALPALIEHQAAQLAPASDERLMMALTQTCALLGFSGSQASRTEWIAAAIVRMRGVPHDLVFEALREADESCTRVTEVVKAVFDYLEDLPSRRKARMAKLLVLAEAIG